MSNKLEKEIKRAIEICRDEKIGYSWEEIESSYKFLIKNKIVKLIEGSFYLHKDHVFMGEFQDKEYVWFGFNGMNFKF